MTAPAITEAYNVDRLHVEASGPEDAPLAVVILHGWGSSAQLMQPVAGALAETCRVYNVDLPGHGMSPPPPSPWGVPEHAALVHELISSREDRPVVLLGHSNGGRIALYMAGDDKYSADIRALVLVSPSGVRRKRTAGYYVRRGVAGALKAPFELLPDGKAKDFATDWLKHSLVWRMLGSSDYRSLEGVMRGTFVKTVNHYVEDRLAKINIPALLFRGSNDEAVTRRQIAVLETGLPDSGLVVLEGAGHYGFLDDFDVFVSATERFLEGC